MKRLRIEREQRGLSRAALARKAEMCEGNYGQVENGRRLPYQPELARIAGALGWPAERAQSLLEEVETA